MRAWIFAVIAAIVALSQAPVSEAGEARRWQWMTSKCRNCGVEIRILKPTIQAPEVEAFLRTLSEEKSTIVALYRSSSQEYNLLAHMAVGILGRESMFFKSAKYQFKEANPQFVRLLKHAEILLEGSERKPTVNSRGPTQIKVVPTKIAEHYGVTSANLNEPANAAVATMGYLIEALAELKNRARAGQLPGLGPANYVDYLPYIYFGRTKALLEGTATPEKNLYVQAMKRFMDWVEVYETAPVRSPEALP